MPKVIKMPKSDYLKEHKHLVKVLRHPTKAKLKAEDKEQTEEVKKSLGVII